MKFKTHLKLIMTLLLAVSLRPVVAAAQNNADDLEVIDLENLYKKEEVHVQAPPSAATGVNAPVDGSSTGVTDTPATTVEPAKVEAAAEAKEEIRVKELKDLNQLVPFSEISVIQKKFMPKSGRFQFYAGLGLATNTPWYNNYGGKLNLSYNFIESFGIEISTLFLTSSPRDVAKEIKQNNNVEADQFIYTKGYYGLDLVWSPIYGKIAFDNSKIINYEMYFSFGGGTSQTNSVEKDVPTGHISVGQIFSISKSMAFRWDYGINIFQATPQPRAGATTPGEKGTYNDLVLTAGFSFFFPEVTYR